MSKKEKAEIKKAENFIAQKYREAMRRGVDKEEDHGVGAGPDADE